MNYMELGGEALKIKRVKCETVSKEGVRIIFRKAKGGDTTGLLSFLWRKGKPWWKSN